MKLKALEAAYAKLEMLLTAQFMDVATHKEILAKNF